MKPSIPSSNALEQGEYFGNKFHSFHEFVHKVRARSSLLKIKRRINKLQRIINAPKELRPSYGAFEYADSYFIEIDTKGVMRLIETEHGRIHEVRRTKDLDELLYWIFTNITFAMACKQELENSPSVSDKRIGIFLQQEELLGKLYPHWQDKKHAEYEAFIKNHPKDDTS
ncbi:MAG: Imm63 family immunity protein, partial [Bacteroidales bacterium]